MKWDQRYVTEKLRDAVNEKIISREGEKRWQYSVEPRISRGILCGISLEYHRGKSVVGTLRGI